MSRSPKPASILLIDVGNTRIKWAYWRHGRLGRQRAEVYADWSSEDFARHVFGQGGSDLERAPARILVSNVADQGVLRRLAAGAARARHPAKSPPSTSRDSGAAALEIIETSRRAAGVVTRYREPWRLGVDRFLGVIAAHQLAGSRGACVINAGTAVTIDLVDGQGVHRGGAILPGPRLMVESLLRRTAGIARRARASNAVGAASRARASSHAELRLGSRSESFLARDTARALEQGAANAVLGAVERALIECDRELEGVAPLVVLTGGGAAALRRRLRVGCTEVPDLVLRGIALHAGLALR